MSSSSQAQAPAPIVLARIPAPKLADILLDEHTKGKVAVVDVRDDGKHSPPPLFLSDLEYFNQQTWPNAVRENANG
jgi:hypothetical protein